jgi:hypothetical protein
VQAGAGAGGEIILHLLPVRFDSKEKFHAFLVEETKEVNARLKKAMARTGATVTGDHRRASARGGGERDCIPSGARDLLSLRSGFFGMTH